MSGATNHGTGRAPRRVMLTSLWMIIAATSMGWAACSKNATHPVTPSSDLVTAPTRPVDVNVAPPTAPPPQTTAEAPQAPQTPSGATEDTPLNREPGSDTKAIQEFGALSVPHGALDHLKARMSALKDPTANPVTIVHYGDSHSKGSTMIKALREHLGAGTPSSPGTLSVGHPARWSATLRKFGRWTRHNWLYGRDKPSFGPIGVAYSTTSPRARMVLTFQDGAARDGTRITVLYELNDRPLLPFKVMSGRKTLTMTTASEETSSNQGPQLGRATVEVPEGSKKVELRVACTSDCPEDALLRVYGVSIEHPEGRIAYDNFGVGGTTIIGPHKRSDQTLDQYLRWRAPDLMVLWYGANSSPEPSLVIKSYHRRYRELVARMRKASPGSSCLLIGPPDLARYKERDCFMNDEERRLWRKGQKTREDRRVIFRHARTRACNPDARITREGGRRLYPGPGIRTRRQWETYKEECSPRTPPKLPEIVRVQREVADELGCAYFNAYEDMGGEGAMMDWVCKEQPPLGSNDLIHLTQRGYTRVADRLYESLAVALGDPPE